MVSDTIKFRHHKLTLLSVTPEDKVLDGVQNLTSVIKYAPASTADAQIQSINSLQDALEHWLGDTTAPTDTTAILWQTLSS